MLAANRRQFLTTCAVTTCTAGAGISLLPQTASADSMKSTLPAGIRFCLNTSTIRGQKLSLEEEIDLVAAAGYDGIEPWVREIEAYQATGKSLADLKKRIADQGLRVESSIGFAPWIVNDEEERRKGLEQLQRDMELVQSIGGNLIAAPPIGLHTAAAPQVDLFAAAERYRAALEVGRNIGVTPQLEIWGFSRNLSRLGEIAFVCVESNHPDACILPDVYHIYKGGSGFAGLNMFSGKSIRCFHFNDYPVNPPRAEINDSKRVYPGDGIAPWPEIVSILNEIGFAGTVSLELFNEAYWKQDPLVVLKTGLQKMKSVWSLG